MIVTQGLTKTYSTGDGTIYALNDVHLQVHEGEFLAITGRSGSGKSTLLYQLGLLDYPTSGSIVINGVDVLKLSSSQRTKFRLRELGYVFQDYALLPSLTALENVMLPLLMQNIPKRTARMQSMNTLERIGLLDRINNLPSQLSGGQQQRVAIARAIAHDPKILFADEPTANLDTETSKTVLDTFLELHKDGQTIAMVTHESDYAALGDRIIVLQDGEILSDKKNRKASGRHEKRGSHHQRGK